MDIRAEQAWALTKGNSAIKVAVIDDGVDSSHPDLQGNILGGYDATDGAYGGTNGNPINNGLNTHGTACAGIIAAADNSFGVVGIAPNVKIVPIRAGYEVAGTWETDEDLLADAIRYAWETAKADVLSCSWGGRENQDITDAINAAVENGRDGKGCVVVFAAGNEGRSTHVSYPAILSNVIAVGSANRNGRYEFYSNYGTNSYNSVNVVAPGNAIYTTGMPWASPAIGIIETYSHGTYFSNFGGTSASAPYVAGVAALILSARPDLGQQTVRDLIAYNCTKLSYHGNNTNPGSWVREVGFGLVNAYKSLKALEPAISGPDVISRATVYTLGHGNGTWEISSSNPNAFSISVSSDGKSATVTPLVNNGTIGTITVSNTGLNYDEARKTIRTSGSPSIVGSSTICNSETYTLSSGNNATWSLVQSGNIFSIPPNSNGNSVTVTASVLKGGTATIKAMSDGIEITRLITACNISPSISGPSTTSTSAQTEFSVSNLPQDMNNITWGGSNLSNGSYNALTRKVTFTAAATNSTGYATVFYKGVEVARFGNVTIVSPISISTNPSYITCGVTFTCSINNLPQGVSNSQIVWSSSSNMQMLGTGNTGQNKQFKAIGYGSGWIQASIGSYGTFRRYNTMEADMNLEEHQLKNTTCGTANYIAPPSIPGVISYRWVPTYAYFDYNLSSTYGLSTYFTINENGFWGLLAFPITECGESGTPVHYYPFYATGGRSSSSGVTFYPNPVNDILNIEIDERIVAQAQTIEKILAGSSSRRLMPVLEYDFRLYDGQGSLLRQRKTMESSVQFNVSNLPNGFYYLHIYDGINEKPEMQQIIIQH